MSAKQTVLVTGSSNGFGNLMVRSLLDKGYIVFATMRNAEGNNAGKATELRRYAEGKQGVLHVVDLDVSSDNSVEKGIARALELEGHLDVVVNNAGYGVIGYSEAVPTSQLEQIFDVNVIGVQRVNRAVLPSMRKRGSGLLIHISSVMGRIVLPFAGPYTASKYALEGLAEGYRYELAATGVDVTIIEPGGFGTNFAAAMLQASDSARRDSYGELKDAPEQMWGSIEDSLKSENAPDPQLLADAVLAQIGMPAGTRPLRTVVDPMSGGAGPTAINATTDQIQQALLGAFGMAGMLSVKKS